MKDDDNVISEEITSDKTIWMCTEVLLFLFFLQVYFLCGARSHRYISRGAYRRFRIQGHKEHSSYS